MVTKFAKIIISSGLAYNNIVTKFKNDVRLNFLNLGICTLCIIKKIFTTNEA
jgi:hypothetical protein